MKYSLEILKSIFIDKLQDFKSANAAYLAAEHEFIILILIMVLRVNLKPFERNYKLLVLIWNIVL